MVFWRSLYVMQFLLLLILFTWLGLTSNPSTHIPMYNDKLMHFAGYVIAGFSISFAFPRGPLWQRALFLIIFSIGIEIGQHFLPPRTFDVFDIVANSAGVIAGLACVIFLYKRIQWFNQLLFLNNR
jgi:VanZ family protein